MQDKPTDEDSWASVDKCENHVTCNLRINDNILEGDNVPERLTNVLTHELLHLYHRDVDDLFYAWVVHNTNIPVSQTSGAEGEYVRQMERLVSSIGRLLSPHLPQWGVQHEQDDFDIIGIMYEGENA